VGGLAQGPEEKFGLAGLCFGWVTCIAFPFAKVVKK